MKDLPEKIQELMLRGLRERAADAPAVPAFGEEFVVEDQRFDGVQVQRFINDWLRLDPETGDVAAFDYDRFLAFVAKTRRLKDDPAFDESGYRRISGPPNALWDPGESNLFGDEEKEYSLFTEFSWNHADRAIEGMGKKNTGLSWQEFLETEAGKLVEKQIKTVSPFTYLDHGDCDSAPYWYVRHGMRDRDTSFAIETLLYYALRNEPAVKDLNFRFTYLYPHAGNYDAPEAFAWLAGVLEKNEIGS